MAFTIDETWASGDGSSGQNASDELVYIVSGDPNPAVDNAAVGPVAQAYAESHIASAYNGKLRSDLKRTRISDGTWLMTATYGLPQASGGQTGTQEFSFSTSGNSEHITQAKTHIGTYISGDLPVYGGGPGIPSDAVTTTTPQDGFLDVNGGEAGGIDVDFPAFGFDITLWIATEDMTADYVTLLYMLTNTVNATAGTFTVAGVPITFNEGEVRFKGADGSIRNAGDWEITLHFAALPNADALTFGTIRNIPKKGWQYISLECDKTVDDTDPDEAFIAPKVVRVQVNEIYPSDNWTGLVPDAA